jgi:hypothetical protein
LQGLHGLQAAAAQGLQAAAQGLHFAAAQGLQAAATAQGLQAAAQGLHFAAAQGLGFAAAQGLTIFLAAHCASAGLALGPAIRIAPPATAPAKMISGNIVVDSSIFFLDSMFSVPPKQRPASPTKLRNRCRAPQISSIAQLEAQFSGRSTGKWNQGDSLFCDAPLSGRPAPGSLIEETHSIAFRNIK